MAFDDNYSSGFRTKKRILHALTRLLEEQPYEKIDVVELCREADIARSTFYHHFYSKDDMLAWHTTLLYRIGLDRIGRDLDCYTGHLITTRELYPYRHLYTGSPANLDNLAGPRSFFIRHRYETLCETVTDYHHLELTPLLKFQIEALSVAEAHMSKNFFQGSTPLPDLEEYCRAAVTLVPADLFEIINNPVSEPVSEFMLLGLD